MVNKNYPLTQEENFYPEILCHGYQTTYYTNSRQADRYLRNAMVYDENMSPLISHGTGLFNEFTNQIGITATNVRLPIRSGERYLIASNELVLIAVANRNYNPGPFQILGFTFLSTVAPLPDTP